MTLHGFDGPCAERQDQEPTATDYCAADGHAYHGVGRCYCGARTYPTADEVRRYTEGECLHLAVALHALTGWEIAELGGAHAIVVEPDHAHAWDINGRQLLSALEVQWGVVGYVWPEWADPHRQIADPEHLAVARRVLDR